LLMAMNPCPCGYYGDHTRACTCTPTMIARYQSRLSGPLMDRVDIHLDVPRVDYDKLLGNAQGESSAAIRARVQAARGLQARRFAAISGVYANGDMGVNEIEQFCTLSAEASQLLELSVRRLGLSARAYHRVLKLSRTIADLAGSERIELPHVAEAVQYRPKVQA
ncbi:MAG: ATP-binding protein, partial [Blastochloris sp.]|nr:ATP-binding protein [Blastochloris sp.]